MAALEDILVIDIETISGTSRFEELSAAMQHQWSRKASFLRNDQGLSDAELFFDRGAIYAEFGKVIVIAVGIIRGGDADRTLRIKSFASHEEKELLQEFADFLSARFDPQRLSLCAHNGKEFDFPYLCRRLLINGIPIPDVLDLSGKKPWEVHHIDTMELWKFGDRKNFTSLDLLTEIFGIDSSKSDMDGSQVNRVYYEEDGLERIAEYCKRDVVATAQLYLKMNCLPTIPEDRITILPQPNG